jgi:hypothetical protein
VIFFGRESPSSRDAATSPEPSQCAVQEENPFREKLVSVIGIVLAYKVGFFDIPLYNLLVYMKIL